MTSQTPQRDKWYFVGALSLAGLVFVSLITAGCATQAPLPPVCIHAECEGQLGTCLDIVWETKESNASYVFERTSADDILYSIPLQQSPCHNCWLNLFSSTDSTVQSGRRLDTSTAGTVPCDMLFSSDQSEGSHQVQ